jgi:hypothetical protein
MTMYSLGMYQIRGLNFYSAHGPQTVWIYWSDFESFMSGMAAVVW